MEQAKKQPLPLQREFDYFLRHHDDLLKDYNGKHLVIIGEKVIGAYDTHEDALFTTEKEHPIGTFLIQLCTPGDEAYTQAYHSRVTFV